MLEMWSLVSGMGPTEPKLKGGYHTHASFFGVASLAAINPDKQFPCIKPCPSQPICRQSYNNMDRSPPQTNSSAQEPTKKGPQQCNGRKKRSRRRRRRRRKKNCSKCEAAPQQRQRLPSTTSEDSFIMFEEDCQISDDTDTETVEYSSDSTVTQKKVRFADDLCQVHPMVKWSYAYQAARKGPWEEYARDRDRFRKRVRSTEACIGHVFTKEHRTKIYNQRFV